MVVGGGVKVSKRSKTEGDTEEKLDENKVRIYGLTRVLSNTASLLRYNMCSCCCSKVLGAENPKTYNRRSQVTAHIGVSWTDLQVPRVCSWLTATC